MLESIALSHYVEKVRWALDILAIDYEEEQDVGIVGAFFTGRMACDYLYVWLTLIGGLYPMVHGAPTYQVPGLRLPGKNFTVYNSPDILRYLYGKFYNDPVGRCIFTVVLYST